MQIKIIANSFIDEYNLKRKAKLSKTKQKCMDYQGKKIIQPTIEKETF